MLLFVSWRNKYAITEWPLFDAPTSTHGVFTSFSLSRYCCLHFCISVEISFGSFWRRDILRVKGQALFTNCNFLWLCVICNCWVATIWCATKYPWCLYFFSLSKCCCLHFCRNKFGLLLVQGYFKGQRSSINKRNCNFLHVSWHNHMNLSAYWVATTWCADKYPCLFYFFYFIW